MASIATPQVACFVVSIRERDYAGFRLRDNQGRLVLPCSELRFLTGPYDVEVTDIEAGQTVIRLHGTAMLVLCESE